MKKPVAVLLFFGLALPAVAISALWGAWYAVAGSVPTVSAIRLTHSWVIELPVTISRWWDVLMGPFWVAILIGLFRSQRIQRDEKLKSTLFTVSILSTLPGLYPGFAIGLGDPARAAAILTLFLFTAFGAIIGGVANWREDLASLTACCLGVGIGSGIGASVGAGVAIGVIAGITFGLTFTISLLFVAGLTTVIRQFSRSRLVRIGAAWRAIRRWPVKREIARYREQVAQHLAHITELEAQVRQASAKSREQETRFQEQERQHAELIAWCAECEGSTVEELQTRFRVRKAWVTSLAEGTLSARLRKALAVANIRYLGELAGKSEEELILLTGIGRPSLTKIKQELNRYGLTLGMQPPGGPPPHPTAPETSRP